MVYATGRIKNNYVLKICQVSERDIVEERRRKKAASTMKEID
jgi:hypothetical protein